jgi:TP901 family phage tail tape measure protein
MTQKANLIITLKDNASKGVKKLSTNLKDFGKSVISSKFGIAALGAAIGFALKDFADFEKQLVNVGNLFDATNEQVEELGDGVLEISRRLPVAASDLADGLFDVISAGVDAADSIEFLGVAATLAAGGMTTVSIAVDGLTSSMNAFGIASEDAGKVADKFFAAQQEGKTTIEELSTEIGKVAPIAAAMGLSIDEVLGSIAALTKQGIKTNIAVTQIRSALTGVLKPSKEAAELADDLGIKFNEQALAAQGLVPFLENIIDKTGGSAEQLSTLFGRVEAVNAVLALSKGEFGDVNEALIEIESSFGRTEKAADKISDTLSGQFSLAMNNVLSATKTVIAPLAELTKWLLKGFNASAKWLSKLTPIPVAQEKVKESTEKTTEALEDQADATDALIDEQIALINAQAAADEANNKRVDSILKSEDFMLAELRAKRDISAQEERDRLKRILVEEKFTGEARDKIRLRQFSLEEQMRKASEKGELDSLKKIIDEKKTFNDLAAENNIERIENQIESLNQILENETLTAEQRKLLEENILETQKSLGVARVELAKKTADEINKFSTAAAQALTDSEKSIGAVIGDEIKARLNAQIDALVAAEIAKATAAAPLTFGASLAAIGPIVVAGIAGKAAINAIQFHEGGVVGGGSGSETNFNRKLRVNEKRAILQDGERVMTQATDSELRGLLTNLNASISKGAAARQTISIKVSDREIARASAKFQPAFQKLNRAGSL